MDSAVQHGRRRGSSKRGAASAEEASRMFHPPDLRQVTVLSKAEWLRIQDELNQVEKAKERMREVQEQREALHLKSEELVKTWSNTIAGQRQKKLEAKKIRDEIEEERRKQIDKEEAKYQEEKQKEALEKAKTQLYHQTGHVRGLHRALLLSEVLKERETQIEMKQRIKSASTNVDKNFLEMVKTRKDEALREEQEKKLQKKMERLTLAEILQQQIKENEVMRQRKKMEDKKDAEEIKRLKELHHKEKRLEEEREAEQKRNLMHAHLEHLTQRDLTRATEAQKEQAEEEQRKLFCSAKRKMMKLRKDRESELFREAQMCREEIMNKVTVNHQEQTVYEELRISKALAEQEAKQAQQQREEEERRAAMMKGINAHRELMKQEKEQRDKTEKQNARDRLQATKEADRIFTEKQQLKAQQRREDRRNLLDFNTTQMAEKGARIQRLRKEEHQFEEKNAELLVREDNKFQQYSQHVIKAAAEAQQNLCPLYKAAREGQGGSFGPASCGVRPVYLVLDCTGAQMPKYVSGISQNIKQLNDAADIQDAKRRLGFTW